MLATKLTHICQKAFCLELVYSLPLRESQEIVSGIVHLKKHIEMECAAMRLAMTGFRTTASHDIINHQFDRLGEHYEQLGELIGLQAAIETVIAALERKEPCQ